MENKIRKRKIMLVAITVMLVVSVSSVYALLSSRTNTINNQFVGGGINITVKEKGKDHEDSTNQEEIYGTINKKNETIDKVVTVKNKNRETYVRVRLVPVLKNEADGSVLGKSVDLTYTFAKNTPWRKAPTGEYYYSEVLGSYNTSDVLLEKVKLNEDLPDGYILELQVIVDAIAASTSTNLKAAWNITDFSGMSTKLD